jgi:hypothetical protein
MSAGRTVVRGVSARWRLNWQRVHHWRRSNQISLTYAALLALFFAFNVFVVSPRIQGREKIQQSAQIEPAAKSPDERVVDYTLALVIFNGILAVSTTFLWLSTRRLWRGAEAQAVHIQASAEAATASAEALTVIERAHIYPQIVHPGAMGEWIHDSIAYFLEDEGGEYAAPLDIFCEVSFQIMNFGKTPAVIKAIYAEIGLNPEFFNSFVIEDSVLASGQFTRTLTAETLAGLSKRDAEQIREGVERVRFRGSVIFLDIWNAEHTTRFEFVWLTRIGRWELCSLETHRLAKAE